jgi:predicted amidohydrolase
MKVAAIQLESRIADVAENLRRCEQLGDEAGAAGAEWIILPEFFSSGMGYLDSMAETALPPDGAAMVLLKRLASRHNATVGGSFICRDEDGNNRNAFFLVAPDGSVLGRHNKDLPTMWENCYYIGGTDDGVIKAGDITVGAALCWEFMRTQTPLRLRDRVDMIVGGSAWWSVPEWPPKVLTEAWERDNARTAAMVAPAMSRAVGVPVVHSAHSGLISCGIPWAPLKYNGWFQGGAVISDAQGKILARRDSSEGPGIVTAEVNPGREVPTLDIPNGFWFHPRGIAAAFLWFYQNPHGRGWYRKHALGRPTADQVNPALSEKV